MLTTRATTAEHNVDQLTTDKKTLQGQYDELSDKLKDGVKRVEDKIDAIKLHPDSGAGVVSTTGAPYTPAPAASQSLIPQCGIVDRSFGTITYTSQEDMVVFSSPLAYTPRVIFTTSKIDIDCTVGQGLNYSSYVRDVTKDGFAMTRSLGNNRAYGLDSSWMSLPENDIHIETGTIETANFARAFTTAITPHIGFKKAFGQTPMIHTWIQGLDFPAPAATNDVLRLQTVLDAPTSTGFGLQISTWANTTIANARIGWIAYDATEDGKRIKSGLASIDGNSRKDIDKLNPTPTTKRTAFQGQQRFSRKPAVFAAWSKIDMVCGKIPRLIAAATNPDQDGFDLTMSTWLDNVVYNCDGFWLAME